MIEDPLEEQGWREWGRAITADSALPPLDPALSSATELRILVDNLPALCSISRADGTIVWLNRRWRDYCGIRDDAIDQWSWQSAHDPDQLPEVEAKWASCIATGEPFEMTFPLRGADGVFRSFLTRVTPLRDASGAIARWYGVGTDISGQGAARAALIASESKLQVLTDAMPQMVWSTLPDGYHDYYNAQWYEFTGMLPGSTDGEGWNGMFHPDDQDRAWARWRHSLSTGEPYEIEYRLRHRSGDYRWTLGRALPVRNAAGEIIRWIGTCTDIDAAKRVAEQNELLGRELSHRIKNIFAVIAGLIGLSARRIPEAKAFAQDLRERVAALGRAHEFARPHSEESKPVVGMTTLHGMLRELFKPYASLGKGRINLQGDDIPIDDRGATPIALIFHELATNAAKYGALSTDAGSVQISSQVEGDDLTVEWRESNGPAIVAPPTEFGFGTRLAALSVEQLGGAISREWPTSGLVLTITLRPDRLLR